MEVINSKNSPQPIGPFVQAMLYDKFLFCSGQVGINPLANKITGSSIEEQTLQIFTNMKAVLGEAGLSLDDIIKTNVYLTSMNDFVSMNAVYEKQFGQHKPARTTVAVSGLPLNALVEIECIAVKEQNGFTNSK